MFSKCTENLQENNHTKVQYLLCNFFEITLRHGVFCKLLHIFRTLLLRTSLEDCKENSEEAALKHYAKLTGRPMTSLIPAVSNYELMQIKFQINPLKVHYCRFENLPTCLNSFKDYTLRISANMFAFTLK